MSMKAIDFACRLLARLNRDSMPAATRQVLLAVAAGKSTQDDIARLTGLRYSTCGNLVNTLASKGYVKGLKDDISLTACGKDYVSNLFSFQRKEEA